MNYIEKPIAKDQFFLEEQKKTGIVLHYTAGPSVSSAYDWWKQTAERVATAFIVDLNGDVYRVFPEECWAWHLAVGQKGVYDKATIGIELVNPGPLRKDISATGKNSDAVYTWYDKKNPYPYEKIITTRQVLSTMESWRGEALHAAFPSPQIVATAELCHDLSQKFGIPLSFDNRTSTILGLVNKNPEVGKHHGLSTHSNWVETKTDLGPWFPWSAFLRELSQ